MVASSFVELRSPLAKSCLVGISVALVIDAALITLAANSYPYLADIDDIYIEGSRTILVVYIGLALGTLLMAASTIFAAYKPATNYVLVHASLSGIFVPVCILIYFTSSTYRYNVKAYEDFLGHMIKDYRIPDKMIPSSRSPNSSDKNAFHVKLDSIDDDQTNEDAINKSNSDSFPRIESIVSFKSFKNFIDSIQSKLGCCGVNSLNDWKTEWDDFIAPSCCKTKSKISNSRWAERFNVNPDFQFTHCQEANSFSIGCRTALKDEELSKNAWLSNLIWFTIILMIGDTVLSLLLIGLTKAEDCVDEDTELSIVGVSSEPRPSQPTILGIKSRPSVVQNMDASREIIAARAQAVRFNISNSPRASVSGPSKFSAAARRGSSFI